MELNEDVLGVVVEFVGMVDARAVRATCKELRDVAARVAWRERKFVLGSRLRLWRACFPRAQAVMVKRDVQLNILSFCQVFVAMSAAIKDAEDADLQWVEGVLDVDLCGCSSITDEGLVHLGSATTVNLSHCRQITDEGLRHLGHVTKLNLMHCEQITDAGLRHLGHVTTLNLMHCEQITDAGLRHLGHVTAMSLSWCKLITDAGLLHLRSVRRLGLRFCPEITEAGRANLRSGGVSLL